MSISSRLIIIHCHFIINLLSLQGGSTTKLKRPTFHSSRGSLTGENGGTPTAAKPGRSGTKPCTASLSHSCSTAVKGDFKIDLISSVGSNRSFRKM